MSVFNEEYMDTFGILPKDQKECNNTVTTNAGSFNTWGDPNVHSENVNKIKPEDVHLDWIDNKTDNKRTPVKIAVEKKDEKVEDKIVLTLTEKRYSLLTTVLDDYKRLLYKEVSSLSENHKSVDEIECYTQKIRQVREVLNFIDKVFVIQKSPEAEIKVGYLPEEWWRDHILYHTSEEYKDLRFFRSEEHQNEGGMACLDSQNQ